MTGAEIIELAKVLAPAVMVVAIIALLIWGSR